MDYDFFYAKKEGRLYISKAIEIEQLHKNDEGDIEKIKRPIRIASTVIDNKEDHEFIKDGQEIVLRITKGKREEIKAKFYEDTRNIYTLTIQKYLST